MNGGSPLAKLKDIHLPPPVSWWPPAPGWWLLALVAVVGLAGLVYLFRRFQQRKYRRVARSQLRRLQENPEGLSDWQRLAEVAALVRRVALVSCGRVQVASLSGSEWLAFLDQSGGSDQFTSGAGKPLGADLYRPEAAVDLHSLFIVVDVWIRRHRSC